RPIPLRRDFATSQARAGCAHRRALMNRILTSRSLDLCDGSARRHFPWQKHVVVAQLPRSWTIAIVADARLELSIFELKDRIVEPLHLPVKPRAFRRLG